MNDRMRIGDLTERAEVTPRTVRYYQSIGLLPPGEREGHGQHYYTEETLARLRKIDQLKKLGLSLGEIHDVIDLYFTDPSGRQPKQKVLAIWLRTTRRSLRSSNFVLTSRAISNASSAGLRKQNITRLFLPQT